MQGRILVVSVLIGYAGLGCATGPGASEAQRVSAAVRLGPGAVKSIEFMGNDVYGDRILRSQLGFKVGQYLDPTLAETGRVRIGDYYRKKGFAFVRVMLNTAKLSEGEVIYTVDEGPRVKIRSVGFRGNDSIPDDELKKVVKTARKRWFVLPIYYVEEKVAEDVERLKRAYYDRGFLNHHIEAQGEYNVVFVIDEGPQYTVRNITFVGVEHFEAEALRTGLELKSGQTYLNREADAHVRKLLKLYRENGFVDVDVEHKPRFAAEAGVDVVDVEFAVNEGEKFRLGRVDITGNQEMQDRVIRRVLDEYGFTPGELYNADMAPRQGGGELETRVKRATLAEEATIRPVKSGQPGQKNAVVDVKEGLTGFIMPGVGVSSDSGVIGRLVYDQRNFNIHDKPESFKELITMKAFKGGGQRLRIALEPGTEVSEYSIGFTEPYLYDKPTSLNLLGSSYERYRESYNEGRLKGYFGLEKRLKNKWRRGIGFRVENVEVRSLDDDAPQEIVDFKGENALAGIRLGIGRDLTDDEFWPTTGYVLNAGYEQVAGDNNFGLLSGSIVRYKTIHEDLAERKTVLATKLLGGTTVGEAPPYERYYAGGTGGYGIRGFEYRGVSPRGLQRNVTDPKLKDPIGSDWIFLASAEVAVPLVSNNFAALFFMDSGAVETGGYRAAVGTGIQIMIPQWFGPVPMRFEIATPFMKDSGDDTQIFNFSAGALF